MALQKWSSALLVLAALTHWKNLGFPPKPIFLFSRRLRPSHWSHWRVWVHTPTWKYPNFKSMISPLEIVMWPHFITKLTSERILLQPQGSVTFIGGSIFWIKSWDMWNIYIYVMNLWGSLPSNMGLWWLNYLHQPWGWSMRLLRFDPLCRWGSFFCPQKGWGYACCRSCDRHAPACRETSLERWDQWIGFWVVQYIYIYLFIYRI